MNVGEMKVRRDTVRTRIDEIDAQLAEMKRSYVVDGVNGDLRVKATLAAERANAKLELGKLDLAIHAERKTELAIKHASFEWVLLSILQERGFAELIKEAQRISMDRFIGIQMVATSTPNEERVI
jgi:hypothetical protein